MFYKEDLKKILNFAFGKNPNYQNLSDDDKVDFLEDSLNQFYALFFREVKLTIPKNIKESELEKFIEDHVLSLDEKFLDRALQNSMGVVIPQAISRLEEGSK